MLKFEATRDVPNLATVRSICAREVLVVAAMLCGLAQGGECLADDLDSRKPLALPPARDTLLTAPTATLAAPAAPLDLGPVSLPPMPVEHGSQFSPRKHFAPDEPLESVAARADSLRTTTVWQRLNDYRSKDRVRLVTLWETSGSSVSLQAGRHGEPSLQWSSRSMNRGGATRGLLDSFVAASLGAAGVAITQPGNSRGTSGPGVSTPAVRPVRPATVAAFESRAP